MAVAGSHVGDRPADLVGEFPAAEAGGKVAAAGSHVGDRAAVAVGQIPTVETGGKMAAAGSHVGDCPAVPVCEFPTVEAGGKIAAACSHVGDRAAAFLFPVLQRGSMGKSPREETGEGGELFPQHLGGRFRRDGIAVDGAAPDLSGGKVVGFPPALLFGQVQGLEGLRVGEKVGNRKLERGNTEEKGSELAHIQRSFLFEIMHSVIVCSIRMNPENHRIMIAVHRSEPVPIKHNLQHRKRNNVVRKQRTQIENPKPELDI